LVVTTYNGLPTLMIRIANGRMSLLTDLNVRLNALMGENTSEGHHFRRVHDLTLSRSHVPMFALTLTVMHPIDQDSPLAGHTAESLVDSDIRLFLSVDAHDVGINSTVHDIKDYRGHQIMFAMRYADAVSVDSEGRTVADLTRLSLIEPDVADSVYSGLA
jgi:inward rectifier potassium channel